MIQQKTLTPVRYERSRINENVLQCTATISSKLTQPDADGESLAGTGVYCRFITT